MTLVLAGSRSGGLGHAEDRLECTWLRGKWEDLRRERVDTTFQSVRLGKQVVKGVTNRRSLSKRETYNSVCNLRETALRVLNVACLGSLGL